MWWGYAYRSQGHSGFFGPEVIGGCELQIVGCRELILGPLEEQSVLLVAQSDL